MIKTILKRMAAIILSASMITTAGLLSACSNDDEIKATCTTHVDTNDDGKCDNCGADMPDGGNEETPGGNEETPGGNEETPGGNEETPGGDTTQTILEQAERWDEEARYIFDGTAGRSKLYLFSDGVAKFMPSRYYEEAYTGSWTVIDGTLHVSMNKTDDANVAAGTAPNPIEYTATKSGNTYSITIPSSREDCPLEYTGNDAIEAPSAEIPQEEWPERATYAFVDDASNVRSALYLLPFGVAKLMPRTNRATSTCSGTWSIDENTKTITLVMDKVSDNDKATVGSQPNPAEYTIELVDNTYTATITYSRASQSGDIIEETVTVSCTVEASAPSTPDDETGESNVEKSVLFVNRTEKTENDVKLGGYQYLPADAEEDAKLPTIIMSHGLNNSADRFDELATFFAENGYAVFAFNFAGGSQPRENDAKSTGISNDACTVLTEVRDLNAIMDYVKELDFVDTENLFLFGQSQGGWVSTYVAGERSDEVKGLMLYFPAYSIYDDCESGRNDSKSQAYVNDALTVDIYEYLGKYAGTGAGQANKKVIICHGDADTTVNISYSQAAQSQYSENVTLYTIEGAGHGFNRGQNAAADTAETNGYCLTYLQAYTTKK